MKLVCLDYTSKFAAFKLDISDLRCASNAALI